MSVGIDYFGGAFKKPNLTLVWNRAEADGLRLLPCRLHLATAS